MGNQKWSDSAFGERVKRGRVDRGWSQAEFAKVLCDNGIAPMHSTTIAKIELGQRSVRINEAVGIADLFGVSLDTLMGRTSGPADADFAFALRVLRDSAHAWSSRALDSAYEIRGQARSVFNEFVFDESDDLHALAEQAFEALNRSYDAVEEVASLAEEVLRTKASATRKTPSPAKSGKL